MDDFGNVGASGVPSREPFWPWLLRSLEAEVGRRDGSVGPVSDRHLRAVEDVQRELLQRRGLAGHDYSRQRVSKSTVLEVAIELLHAHVFGGRRMPQGQDRPHR